MPNALSLFLLTALAMSYGWGFRGDYGHEAGAMFPGVFLALSILLTAGRADWQRRITLAALAGAIGWAFGGAMSYGKVIGYTAHSSLPDVAYGYASLFIIGALWCAVGAGCLGLVLTMKRSWLNGWAGPLVLLFLVWKILDFTGATEWLEAQFIPKDADGVAALSALLVGLVCLTIPPFQAAGQLITVLSAGWCVGFIILVMALGLRMTPPRGDNWAGSVGLASAFALWLIFHRNRATLYLFLVGLMAGGYGFALADGLNMIGRAGWGFFGELAQDNHLDSWKWMEQSFGFIMGLGVALGIARLVKDRLQPPEENTAPGIVQLVGLLFLVIVMPWLNFFKNVRNLDHAKLIGQPLFGIPQEGWYLIIALALTCLLAFACFQHYSKKLGMMPSRPHGRAQLLLLFLMWLSVLAAFMQAMPHINRSGTLWVHITFWLTAILVSVLTLSQQTPLPLSDTEPVRSCHDHSWRPGWMWWILLALVPVVIAALAYGTTAMHVHPLPGSHLRFEK